MTGVTESTSPKVVVVRPQSPSQTLQRLLDELLREAQRAGLALTVLKAKTIRPNRNWRWKPIELLAPDDADRLYRLVHHGPTMVAAVSSVFVLRDPRRSDIREKDTIRLSDFVAHKAGFLLVNGRTQVATLEPTFDSWRAVVRCDGQDDPRMLPLQTFDAGGPCPELDHDAGRQAFATRYGSGRSRVDQSGHDWRRATARHGRQELIIAGYQLLAGFHWDVSCRKGSGTLLSANAVWSLPRRSYANVYPDGAVRGSKKGVPSIKRIWPR
jgi:hypothetical protein